MTARLLAALGVLAVTLTCAPVAAAQTCAPVAVLASVRNSVQVVRASTPLPANQRPVCAGDEIRVGDNSRAVIVILASNTAVAIDQNTAFMIAAPPAEGGSLVELLRGALLFITRTRGLRVRAPFVTAAVEGTEFVVRAEPDRTVVTVLEGAVRATNAANQNDTVLIDEAQSAEARPGQALRRLDLQPRDAVQWALHYEPVMPPRPFDQLANNQAPDVRSQLERASLLLAVGRVAEAQAILTAAEQADPDNGDALALRTIVAVALAATAQDSDAAVDLGRRAVNRAPTSVAARLALSYALQATFDLEAARDLAAEAARIDPMSGVALARLAELKFALGDIAGARQAAADARAAAPGLARAHAVQGFIALAQGDVTLAEASFGEADGLEPGDPVTRLGLGLAKIRRGDLAGGRQDLEVASALDPRNSLVRSYLAKAYFDEGRPELGLRQTALAKQFDERDPTPWLYEALEKQAQNRPIEALLDVQQSIARNRFRQIYRPRLLLDSDAAVRGARLGRIYRDIGFEQLALVEGWQSLAIDPANYSAHRLLADNYLALSRHGIARDSELLQSQLLQPLNLDAIQPRLADNGLVFLDDGGIPQIGLNEYSRLFVSDDIRFVADGIAGNHGALADHVIVSGLYRKLSFSVGQFHYSGDGVRDNNDIRQDIVNAFVQADVTATTNLQAEFRTTSQRVGDRSLRFDPTDVFRDLSSDGDWQSIRLGARQTLANGSLLLGSYVHQQFDEDFDVTADIEILTAQRTDFVETRYLHNASRVQWTGGAGYYRATGTEAITFGPFPADESPLVTRHANGYAYATVQAPRGVSLTAGLSADSFTESLLERRQVNPKLGVAWNATPATTVRAAAFRSLKRSLTANQTIEPTSVAGFNQFFDDPNATDAWRYGVGVDHSIAPGLHVGAEVSARQLVVPTTLLPTGALVDEDFRERTARGYAYSTLGTRAAAKVEYAFDRVINPDVDSTTHRVPIELRVFHPAGLLSRFQVTYVDQSGRFTHIDGATFTGADRFWVADAVLGFRLPNRAAIVSVDIRNLFDQEFQFQDVEPANPTILPGRRIVGRVTVTF